MDSTWTTIRGIHGYFDRERVYDGGHPWTVRGQPYVASTDTLTERGCKIGDNHGQYMDDHMWHPRIL